MRAALNGNKTANINVKTAVYTNVNGDIDASKIAKYHKRWILLSSTLTFQQSANS